MPTTIATLVIRIVLSLVAAASRAALMESPCNSRSSSAFVTSNTELEMDTPTDMIIPIYDCRLRVEPVSINNPKEPNNTAGTVHNVTSDTLNDWKLAASIRKITITATINPFCRLASVSTSTLLKPRISTTNPRGSLPSEATAFCTSSVA